MVQELLAIVEGYRDNGILITDQEAEKVYRYCRRKMQAAKIQDQEGYLPLLYADELRAYLFRRAVNATTLLRIMGKKAYCHV